MCLPDGTVQVTNPNVGVYSHVFAVQDEGVSAAVKCTVATSGAQSNITGCSQVSFHYFVTYSPNVSKHRQWSFIVIEIYTEPKY